jgi:hypothetical protein
MNHPTVSCGGVVGWVAVSLEFSDDPIRLPGCRQLSGGDKKLGHDSMLEHALYMASRVVSDHPAINLILHSSQTFAPQNTAAKYPWLEHGNCGLNIAPLVVMLPKSHWIAHENVEHPPKLAPGCAGKTFS